jgi:hypothetical protein
MGRVLTQSSGNFTAEKQRNRGAERSDLMQSGKEAKAQSKIQSEGVL